jgi:hypothetical protein
MTYDEIRPNLYEVDDTIWCPECGRTMPWKHKPAPTWRARVANTLRPVLQRAIDRLDRFVEAVR